MQGNSGARGARALTALLLALVALPATGVERGSFLPPDISGFLYLGAEEADGDEDGIRKTQIKRYGHSSGDSVFSMTSGGRLWAWSLASHGRGTDPERNYVLRDSNCDGVFDERYGLDDEHRVPDCLR